MKTIKLYAIGVAAFLILTACASMPSVMRTCSNVTTGASVAATDLTAAITIASAGGLLNGPQAVALTTIANQANAVIATATALCSIGSSTVAKTQAVAAQASVKAATACVKSAPKVPVGAAANPAAVDMCLQVVPPVPKIAKPAASP